MTETDYELLAADMISRTEKAIDTIAGLSVDTGISFNISDIVQRVEDELPADYPESTTVDHTRRDVLAEMARDLLSGEAYDE
ncbi:hypothetical protein [Streptomyces sp. NPDC102264]|uniref:hypothetical protein n=1 Tax=Streptomyces sp. NPDC102264 TaxID=3366149 RepID=UPI0037FE4AE6